MTAYIIILLVLIGYIVYLHYQLTKKNISIDSLKDELALKKEIVKKEAALSKPAQLIPGEYHKSFVKEDKFLEAPIQNFLFDRENEVRLFTHYTKEEETAKQILNEGFQFVDSFHKTTIPTVNNSAKLAYQHNVNKYFGKFIIVISISKKVYDYYSSELIRKKNFNSTTEQILTESSSELNSDHEEVYTFPRYFIKGYLNYETGKIVNNPDYNPNYESLYFKKNLEQVSH